jgi:hypothetical protein
VCYALLRYTPGRRGTLRGWSPTTATDKKHSGKGKQAKKAKGSAPSDEDVRYVWGALSGGRPTVQPAAVQRLAQELGMHWTDKQCSQMIELFAANVHRSQVRAWVQPLSRSEQHEVSPAGVAVLFAHST